jgi:hypothetical protein
MMHRNQPKDYRPPTYMGTATHNQKTGRSALLVF